VFFQIKKEKMYIEKALESMEFNVMKFESELKMLADNQPILIRRRLFTQ